ASPDPESTRNRDCAGGTPGTLTTPGMNGHLPWNSIGRSCPLPLYRNWAREGHALRIIVDCDDELPDEIEAEKAIEFVSPDLCISQICRIDLCVNCRQAGKAETNVLKVLYRHRPGSRTMHAAGSGWTEAQLLRTLRIQVG